jgi:hypothetical protein
MIDGVISARHALRRASWDPSLSLSRVMLILSLTAREQKHSHPSCSHCAQAPPYLYPSPPSLGSLHTGPASIHHAQGLLPRQATAHSDQWRGGLHPSTTRGARFPDEVPLGFFPDWSGRTTAVRFRYTRPVQSGTTQNWMNSNFKSKYVVQSVWSGTPTGSRSFNKKITLAENLACFQI